ncbi:MAG: ATP-binding cassette domain-containing protein, partial [Verrucomicrobiae bacterium]|nr:ATP-binding cassette domain-containing protein [Verrucomicrobiae bacterium]
MPLLEIENLKMHFPVKGGVFLRPVGQCKAVDGVSLSVEAGETLGLVGESGCGKTTLGKCVVRLLEPTAGRLVFDGRDVTHLSRREMLPLRRELQMIFQDPGDSLNSRHTVGNLLEEPFVIHRIGTPADR